MENVEIAELLIKHGAPLSPVYSGHFVEDSPLSAAKDLSIARLLIQQGADWTLKTSNGEAAAASNPYVREILEYNQDPDRNRQNPRYVDMELAAENRRRNKSHDDNVFDVVSAPSKLLVEDGYVNVNARTSSDDPILYALLASPGAAASKVAVSLINKGANVNARGWIGETPLHVVQDERIAALLIEKGANVNARRYTDQTPLHYAKSLEIAKLLIEKGADWTIKDKNGQSAAEANLFVHSVLDYNKDPARDKNDPRYVDIKIAEEGKEKEVTVLPDSAEKKKSDGTLPWGNIAGAGVGAAAALMLSAALGPVGLLIGALIAAAGWFAGGYVQEQMADPVASVGSSGDAVRKPEASAPEKQKTFEEMLADKKIDAAEFRQLMTGKIITRVDASVHETLSTGAGVFLAPEAKDGNIGPVIYAHKDTFGTLHQIQVALANGELKYLGYQESQKYKEEDAEKIIDAAQKGGSNVSDLRPEDGGVDEIVVPLKQFGAASRSSLKSK